MAKRKVTKVTHETLDLIQGKHAFVSKIGKNGDSRYKMGHKENTDWKHEIFDWILASFDYDVYYSPGEGYVTFYLNSKDDVFLMKLTWG